jgi:hypothetical protein
VTSPTRIATYTAVAVLAAVAGASAVAAPSTVPHSLVGCWHRNVPAGGGGIPGIWHIWIRPSGAFAAANPSSQKCNGYRDFSGHITVSKFDPHPPLRGDMEERLNGA